MFISAISYHCYQFLLGSSLLSLSQATITPKHHYHLKPPPTMRLYPSNPLLYPYDIHFHNDITCHLTSTLSTPNPHTIANTQPMHHYISLSNLQLKPHPLQLNPSIITKSSPQWLWLNPKSLIQRHHFVSLNIITQLNNAGKGLFCVWFKFLASWRGLTDAWIWVAV